MSMPDDAAKNGAAETVETAETPKFVPPEQTASTQPKSQSSLQPPSQPNSKPGSDLSGPNLSELLGQAAWVMMRSGPHRHLFVGDLEWLLMPPIGLKQFRLWRRETMPVAFASWALLSDEVEARLIESFGASGAALGFPADPVGADVVAEPSDTAPQSAPEPAPQSTPQSAPQPAFAAPRLHLAPADWQSPCHPHGRSGRMAHHR